MRFLDYFNCGCIAVAIASLFTLVARSIATKFLLTLYWLVIVMAILCALAMCFYQSRELLSHKVEAEASDVGLRAVAILAGLLIVVSVGWM